MIQALIFDFDGLILDTEAPIFRAWQELYQQYALELSFEEWSQTIGTQESPFDPARALEERLGRRIDWEIVGSQRLKREWELVEHQPILPGVLDYLKNGRDLHLKVGLASSSEHDWVDTHLKRLGLFDAFQTIQCYGDVPIAKPDPALYLAALDALGVSAKQAIAFEDSPHGAMSAHRAGLFTVAVPSELTRAMPFGPVDIKLDSLADMSLASLLDVAAQILGKNGKVR